MVACWRRRREPSSRGGGEGGRRRDGGKEGGSLNFQALTTWEERRREKRVSKGTDAVYLVLKKEKDQLRSLRVWHWREGSRLKETQVALRLPFIHLSCFWHFLFLKHEGDQDLRMGSERDVGQAS